MPAKSFARSAFIAFCLVAMAFGPACAQKKEKVKTKGKLNGHEWVDLGLSVKWATCNVGASYVDQPGNLYAWGEISTKAEYTDENSAVYNYKIDNIIGNPQYDVARATWGATWRMPSRAEVEELMKKCKWIWSCQYTVYGYRVIGPNGKSIFLPAAGLREGPDHQYENEKGVYWTGNAEYNKDGAYFIFFYEGYRIVGWNYRNYGASVRPVTE